jgi:hypothetical protein
MYNVEELKKAIFARKKLIDERNRLNLSINKLDKLIGYLNHDNHDAGDNS